MCAYMHASFLKALSPIHKDFVPLKLVTMQFVVVSLLRSVVQICSIKNPFFYLGCVKQNSQPVPALPYGNCSEFSYEVTGLRLHW